MLYLHPVLGVVTLGLVVWLGVAGFRSRHRAPYAAPSRRTHRRWSTSILASFAVTWALGFGTTWVLREPLGPAGTRHAVAATVGLGLMVALYDLGRRLPRDATSKAAHPLVGAALLATSAAILILGLGLLP